MIMVLINLIIYLAVAGLIYWLVIYAIDNIPIPDPPARIIKIVAMVILVLVVISLLLSLIGVDLGMPRLRGPA